MAKSVRFKVGQQVKINAENTGVAPLYRTIAQMGFSNGDTVKLVDYDPEDETWFVQSIDKIEVGGWIKRKNLAPIEAEPQPQPNPFKVGDKVELTNKDAEWASNDNVTTGVEYTVKQVHNPTSGQEVPYIKVEGGDARGVYWIECKYFKKVEPKAKVVDLTDTRGWKEGDILSKDILNDGTYRFFYGFTSHSNKWTSMECKGFYGSDARTIEKIKVIKGRLAAKISECSANIWIAIDTLPVKEEPKPEPAGEDNIVEMECIANHGFTKWLTIGKTYKVHTNKRIAGTFKITGLDQPHKGGPDKDDSLYLFIPKRFKPVTTKPEAETPKKRMAVCVDMSDSHATNYIVGKVYEIREEDSTFYYLAEMDGTRLEGGMFKWRFKEIVDQSTPVGPRVGDTLTERWLKDGTPRFYWGFTTGGGWVEQTVTYFIGDRKIEEIKMKDGRMAAAISGTVDIWIDLEELTGEKSTVDKTITVTVSKDKLEAFDKELQALVAKYK